MEIENAAVLRGLTQVERGAEKVGNSLTEHITNKLKSAFAVGFIEEAVRRNAEWNLELAKSAQELGITTEHLQAYRLVAERAGVAQEKIFNYYNKLEVAATKALSGNQKLAESFRRLGITTEELQTGSGEVLFNKAAGKLNANAPGAEQAMIDMGFSKELLNVKAVARETGGKDIGSIAEENSDLIKSNKDVSEVARAWEQVKEDMMSLYNTLSPALKAILGVIDGLIKMVNGILHIPILGARIAKSAGIGLDAALHGGKFFSEDDANYVKGTKGQLKAVGTSLLNYVPELLTLGFKHPFKFDNKEGISERQQRIAEGIGEGIGTIATFGTGPIARAVGMGAKSLSATAAFVGGSESAGRLSALAGKFSKFTKGNYLASGIGGNLASKITTRMVRLKPQELSEMMEELGVTEKEIKSATDLDAFEALIKERLKRVRAASFINRWGGLLGIGIESGGLGYKDMRTGTRFSGGEGNTVNRNGGLTGGLNFSAMGGSPNMIVGGAYGVNVQLSLISLNQKQLTELQRIASNTSVLRHIDTTPDYNEWVGGS